MARYAADGSTNVTVVDGTTYVGRTAPDGSVNVVVNDGATLTGLHHPSGALNVIYAVSSVSSILHPSGALYVSDSSSVKGAERVTAVSGGLGAYIALSASSLPENSAPGTAIGTLSTVGTTGTASFTLVDDAGGKIALSGTDNVDVVAGATAANYETATNFTFTVSASGVTPAVANRTFIVTVGNINEFSPVISSNGGGGTASISITENTTAVTTVTATDADAATTLTYSISGGADAALFTINPSSGVLSFLTAPDFENPTDADANNQYVVIVQASDGTNTDTQTITVTVTDLGEGGGTTTAITLTDVHDNQVFQRSAGGTTGSVPISGTFTGSAPSTVQGQVHLVDDDSVVVAWTNLTSVSIGSGTWSGRMPNVPQSTDKYYIKVRPAGVPAVTDTGSTGFYMGIVFLLYGQSNMGGFGQAGDAPAVSAVYSWNDTSGDWESKDCGGNFCEQIKTAADCAVGYINGSIAATGIPFLSSDLSEAEGGGTGGGGLWRFYEQMDRAHVTDWEMVLWNQGEGDVTTTYNDYVGYFEDMQSSMTARCGRTIAQMPMVLCSLTTYGDPDDGTNTDANWSRIRATHFDMCQELTNVHFSHSMMDAVRSDAYHYGGAEQAKSGDRFARTVRGLLGFSPEVPAHFEITGGDVLTGTTTRLTITLAAGATDISPASGITGFEVSGDNGATWISATGARTDATHVTLTHSSIATTNQRKVRYQYGMNPDVSDPLRDNSSLTLPCTYTREIISPTPLEAFAAPVFLSRNSAGVEDNSSAPITRFDYNDVGIGSTRGNRTVWFYAIGGVTNLSGQGEYWEVPNTIRFTPDVGTAKFAIRLSSESADSDSATKYGYNGHVSLWKVTFDADADSATTADIQATFSQNPFGGPVFHLWTYDDDLPTTLPYNISRNIAAGAGVDDVSLPKLPMPDHGSFLAVSRCSEVFRASDDVTMTSDGAETIARRSYVTGPWNMGSWDASDTAVDESILTITHNQATTGSDQWLAGMAASFGEVPPTPDINYLGTFDAATIPVAATGVTYSGLSIGSSGKAKSFFIFGDGPHPAQPPLHVTVTPNVGSPFTATNWQSSVGGGAPFWLVHLPEDSAAATTVDIKLTCFYDGTGPHGLYVFYCDNDTLMSKFPIDFRMKTVNSNAVISVSDLTTLDGGTVLIFGKRWYDQNDTFTASATATDGTLTEILDRQTIPVYLGIVEGVNEHNNDFASTLTVSGAPGLNGLMLVSLR